MKKYFEHEDLPLTELENLSLYTQATKQFNLDPNDLEALLAGRRTNLISLKDLETNGLIIMRLDAKLSLHHDETGKTSLHIHPIYREPQIPDTLVTYEANLLLNNKVAKIRQVENNSVGQTTTIFEYDPQTREFISYKAADVVVPEMINGFKLSKKQKESFREGELIELADGTQLYHRASERSGLLANRSALVLSTRQDKQQFYLLVTGIQNLLNAKDSQLDTHTPAYSKALKTMFDAQDKNTIKKQQVDHGKENHSRGYGRFSSR